MNLDKFRLRGEVVIVTGGLGLLGRQYMEAIKEIGGRPISLDTKPCPEEWVTGSEIGWHIQCDITNEEQLKYACEAIKKTQIPIYGLINNACLDPKVVGSALEAPETRLEAFSRGVWDQELAVGLTGAFLATKVFGSEMAANGRGSIINISSVLGHVAPNQALYKRDRRKLVQNPQTGVVASEPDPVKPVTYSVIKHGIIGLTRYVATYWGDKGVRCNALSPGGVYNAHSEEFVQKLSKYIPLGRMANKDEYNCAIQFLLSDASSFMTGAILNIDGGQTCW